MEGHGPAPINGARQEARLVVGERALAPVVPDAARDVVEYVGRVAALMLL
jgi:hypothetical protein